MLKDSTSSTSKITPAEIVQYGSLKNLVARLTQTDAKLIKFRNPLLAEKKVSLYINNDSVAKTENSYHIRHIALHKLLDTYGLNLREENHRKPIWKLSVADEKLFQKCISQSTQAGKYNTRGFYGKNDTIDLIDADSKKLKLVLERNFDLHITNHIDECILFSMRIPNDRPRKLRKYLDSEYGIRLKPERGKKRVLIIE